MRPVLEITRADADLGLIRSVAAGCGIRIAPGLLAATQRRRTEALQALSDGRPVYGVNTGLGALSSVRLTEQQQRSHQRNLLLARATGGPPWLEEPEVRAVITVRLLTFLSGDAAVSGELCQRLADFLNRGLVPAVPRTGAGAAGEIMPLAHAFGPVAGIGRVLRPGGVLVPAAQALREAGLAEFTLGPKEGIALIQGVPGTTGLGALRLGEAAVLISLMEAAAALSIVAARASRDPYRAACARGDDLLAAVLARLRAAIGDDPSPQALQAPTSFRVAGPVLAQVARAADLLEAAVQRALTAVTDSPAYLDGQFTGTAGFHGIDLAAHCDQLTAAFCHAAEVGAARVHRLLDPAVTGLPAQLAREPGPQAGLTPTHKRAAGEVHAMRRLATATPVGLIETSGGQEDVQSFAWEAADKLAAALRHTRAVTACELLAGYQAAALSGRPVPAGSRALLDWLAGIVGPIDGDRPFGEDLERLITAPWPGLTYPRTPRLIDEAPDIAVGQSGGPRHDRQRNTLAVALHDPTIRYRGQDHNARSNRRLGEALVWGPVTRPEDQAGRPGGSGWICDAHVADPAIRRVDENDLWPSPVGESDEVRPGIVVQIGVSDDRRVIRGAVGFRVEGDREALAIDHSPAEGGVGTVPAGASGRRRGQSHPHRYQRGRGEQGDGNQELSHARGPSILHSRMVPLTNKRYAWTRQYATWSITLDSDLADDLAHVDHVTVRSLDHGLAFI